MYYTNKLVNMKFTNANVLITGGASGIGKLMGRMALERGAKRVIIWDINSTSIETTKQEFCSIGEVIGYTVDISESKQITEAYNDIVKEFSHIDILINNAGIITSNSTFDNMSEEEIVKTMQINTIAPMIIARTVLPDMIKRNSGHICTIASAAGLISNPRMSVYTASKWGVIGWSDSIRIELHELKSKIRVTTVAPYYINTGMFNGVKSSIIPILNPKYVARKVIKAIEKNVNFIGIPFGFHFIRFWQWILPTKLFDIFFGEVFGIYHTMDKFTGRKK